ncbi:unnamed protein product, partial [Musa textilis]
MSSSCPFKRTLLHAFGDRGHDCTEVLHKTTIERSKAMKTPYIGDGFRNRPGFHCIHFQLIN